MKYSLIVIFAFLISSVYAEDICDTVKADGYSTLRNVERFTGKAVGIAGVEPDHIKAFRCLLKENETETLKLLRSEGTIPAQLYAMIGLYKKDYEYFQQHESTYINNKDKIETMFGCMVGDDTIENIFKHIKSGEIPNQY